MKEVWKDVIGYEGIYQASNHGRVRSIVSDSHYRGRILKGTLGKLGYLMISLWKGGTSKSISVHRVIAQTFISNPDNKRTVNHINGIKTDNQVSNLEWATDSENNLHAFRYLSRKTNPRRGSLNHKSRKVTQLSMDGISIRIFETILLAEQTTGIAHENISKVAKGQRSHAGGYKWKYHEQ